jgi:hypothetical protein
MQTAPSARVTIDCSNCRRDLVLNTIAYTITGTVESNGLRGSKRVEAKTVTNDEVSFDGDLWYWDCPCCEYADSYQPGL